MVWLRSTRRRPVCCSGPASPQSTACTGRSRSIPEHRDVVAEGEAEVERVTRLDDRRRGHRARAGDLLLVPVPHRRRRITGRTNTHAPGRRHRTVRARPRVLRSIRIGPTRGLPRLAEREVDLVVHLGDYMYEDDGQKGVRPHAPPHTAVTLDDYRQRIAQLREDPDCQALHRRHPMVAMWDDHDLSDNAWHGGATSHDPQHDGPWDAACRRSRAGSPRMVTGSAGRPRAAGAHLAFGHHRRPGRAHRRRHPDRRSRRTGEHGGRQAFARPRPIVARRRATNMAAIPPARHIPPMGAARDECRGQRDLHSRAGAASSQQGSARGFSLVDGRLMHDDQWDGYPAERGELDRLAASAGEQRCKIGDPVRRRALVMGIRGATGRSGLAGGRGVHYPGSDVRADGPNARSGHLAVVRCARQLARPRPVVRHHRAGVWPARCDA